MSLTDYLYRVASPSRLGPLRMSEKGRGVYRKFQDGGVRKGGVAQICRKFLRKNLRKIVSSSCIFDVTPSATDAVAVERLQFASLEGQLTVDEHHTLRNTLRPTPRTANCTSRSCGNFAQILRKLWTFLRILVLLRQRRLRKFCGDSLKCAENVRREVGVQIPLRDACGSANFRNSEKGAFTKQALRKFLRKFCASFASSSLWPLKCRFRVTHQVPVFSKRREKR